MDFSKFLTNRSKGVDPPPTLEEIVDQFELIPDEEPAAPEIPLESRYDHFPKEEKERRPDYSNPVRVTDGLAKHFIHDYRAHAFIPGREFKEEWVASAFYAANFIRSLPHYEATVVVPPKWLRTELVKEIDPSLVTVSSDCGDIIDRGYSFWFWGLEGKHHWLPELTFRKLREDRIRLQVVGYKEKNRWMSDKVLRLSPGYSISRFAAMLCGKYDELLYRAACFSKDSSWMSSEIDIEAIKRGKLIWEKL